MYFQFEKCTKWLIFTKLIFCIILGWQSHVILSSVIRERHVGYFPPPEKRTVIQTAVWTTVAVQPTRYVSKLGLFVASTLSLHVPGLFTALTRIVSYLHMVWKLHVRKLWFKNYNKIWDKSWENYSSKWSESTTNKGFLLRTSLLCNSFVSMKLTYMLMNIDYMHFTYLNEINT